MVIRNNVGNGPVISIPISGKCTVLGKNIWHYRERFVIRETNPEGNPTWMVFNKFEGGKGKDFCFEASSLKDLLWAMDTFSEDIDVPIIPDLAIDLMNEVSDVPVAPQVEFLNESSED